MPFNRHFGFIFLENDKNLSSNLEKLQHTIAHELGHGAFTLYHTFSSKDKSIPQGSTYNLMDYPPVGGQATTKQPDNLLRKYQWHTIHNPRISLFGGEEEEVSEIKSGLPFLKGGDIILIKSTYYFYGSGSDEEFATIVTKGMQKLWNDANGRIEYKGKTYKIKFEITGFHISEEDALAKAKINKSAQYNFVRVWQGQIPDKYAKSKFLMYGNAGLFCREDVLANDNKTGAHEIGHGFGWIDPSGALHPFEHCFPLYDDKLYSIMTMPGYTFLIDGSLEKMDIAKWKVTSDDVNNIDFDITIFFKKGWTIGFPTNNIYNEKGEEIYRKKDAAFEAFIRAYDREKEIGPAEDEEEEEETDWPIIIDWDEIREPDPKVPIIDIALEKNIFSGDNYIEITTKINENSICYFGNGGETKKIKINFKPVFKTQANHDAEKFFIKIEILNGKESLLGKDGEILKAIYNKEDKTYTTKEVSFKLDDLPFYYDKIKIKNYVSLNKDGDWKEIQTYKPVIYITFKKPVYNYGFNNLDERFLYFSCLNANGDGPTVKQKVINGIWRKFEHQGDYTKGDIFQNNFDPKLPGTKIGYYLSHNQNTTDAVGFFKVGGHSGECAAFQDLLIALLEHQGIVCQRISLSPVNEDETFLVKNWEFIGEGSSGVPEYPYTNYPAVIVNNKMIIRLSQGEYNWLGEPEVVEKNGIAGVGNKNPSSDFYFHFIVKVDDTYYDPSYGEKYKSVKEWEEKSIDGFFIDNKYKKEGGVESIRMVIRKNTTLTEIKEK